MNKKQKNPLIEFLASVQLAIFLLFLLASTSIIGTLIQQNNPAGFYVEQYGAKAARLFQLLNITDMYNSWWFLGLLMFFALNLTVCSLERIPGVIRLVRRDNLTSTPEQLLKMPLNKEMTSPVASTKSALLVRQFFSEIGWKCFEKKGEKNTILFFAQKTPWSRYGVYVVHLSILVILAGAIVGSSTFTEKMLRLPGFAYKGFVMLPEEASTDRVYATKSNKPIELGFNLRCDEFHIAFYPNGMPKTYRSKVTILEQGKPILAHGIEVNKPLHYKGVTFYQSSYQPLPQFQAQLKKTGASATQATIQLAQENEWAEAGVRYGIIKLDTQGEVAKAAKIWFSDNIGEPTTFWVEMGKEKQLNRPSGQYQFTLQQSYATGLQVAKDPGVWLVYGGCLLMLLGLYTAFFMSHRKLFVLVTPRKDGKSHLIFAGTANKNKVRFAELFAQYAEKLERSQK